MVTQVIPNTVALSGGTQVTLNGSDLGNGTDITEVRINTIVATIVSQTASSVVVVAPAAAAAGTVRVTVRSVSHGVAALENALTYRTALSRLHLKQLGLTL